jgi:hypothetical protein
MSWTGGKWVRFEPPETHACPKPRILGGIAAPKLGAQWQCDCGKLWEIERDGWQRLSWADTGYVPTRDEVVERMMLTMPAGLEQTADYPGEDKIRQAFLVALLALDRLKLGGNWRKD